MANFPTLVKADLSAFSGRPEVSYSNYATAALAQATLLFKIGTCLSDQWPEDSTEADLAKMAILSLADSIILSQRFQQAAASPFNSESIGSYSYSKTAKAITQGLTTGVMWFDLAIQQLSICHLSKTIFMSGGIEVFEHDQPRMRLNNGNQRLLAPRDLVLSRRFGFDPAPGFAGALPVSVEIEYQDEFVEDPDNPGYYFSRSDS